MRVVRRIYAPNFFIPPLAILGNWMIIAGAIAFGIHFDAVWSTGLSILIIGARQHALFVLMHESVHGHLSRNRFLNHAVSDLFCAFPLLFDTEVYKQNHLKHHRFLNSDADPDWIRKNGQKEWTFPATKKEVLKFIPYFVFYRGPLEWAVILWRFCGFGDRTRWENEPVYLLFKMFYFLSAATIIIYMGLIKEALLYWFIPMFFILTCVGRIRSVAEHFAMTYNNDHTSSRDVAATWLEAFLIAPFNVNYHLTHHLYPHIPFYRLPQAHKDLIQSGEYEGAQLNRSYFLPFNGSVLENVLFGSKMTGKAVEASKDYGESIKKAA